MGRIVVLGVFMADTTYRSDRLPRRGETITGRGFALGPGGKGSNQAVAAALAGAEVRLISRLGRDAFAEMAREMWRRAGVLPEVTEDPDSHTGAACILVDDATGDNAIIITPGAAAHISAADVESRADLIAGADVLLTQLEQPMPAALRALQIARAAGTVTILNPAPAAALPAGMLALCDYVTPNESEAEGLTGIAVASPEDARRAADGLLAEGAGAAIITLGERGVLFHDGRRSLVVPALAAGPVVETTGAGDAFNGGFAAALAEGMEPVAAARFGCAVAAISVTRPGAASSMPGRDEVDRLLAAAGPLR